MIDGSMAGRRSRGSGRIYGVAKPSVVESIEEIQRAIARLSSAANHDNDPRRRRSVEQLELQFTGITNSQELRSAARDALRLYAGGIGSFQDAGTSEVGSAVTRLGEALRQAI